MRTEEPAGPEQRVDKRPFTMFDPCPEPAAYGGASKWQRRPPQGPESSPCVARTPSSGSDLSAPSDQTLSRRNSAVELTAVVVSGRGGHRPGIPGKNSQKYSKLLGACTFKRTRALTPLCVVTRDEKRRMYAPSLHVPQESRILGRQSSLVRQVPQAQDQVLPPASVFELRRPWAVGAMQCRFRVQGLGFRAHGTCVKVFSVKPL
jgi:hypothetical protein